MALRYAPLNATVSLAGFLRIEDIYRCKLLTNRGDCKAWTVDSRPDSQKMRKSYMCRNILVTEDWVISTVDPAYLHIVHTVISWKSFMGYQYINQPNDTTPITKTR